MIDIMRYHSWPFEYRATKLSSLLPQLIGLQNGLAEFDNLRAAIIGGNGSVILAGGYGFFQDQKWMVTKLDSNGTTKIWECIVSSRPPEVWLIYYELHYISG